MVLLSFFAGSCGGAPDNIPYEPDTPAPAAHKGLFVSEHGTMFFDGDGSSVSYVFDEELAGLTGLPAGEQKAAYVFLSGVLPPHGSMPVRYDVSHEMQITVEEQSAVIDIGLASEDGKSASSGTGIVTPTRIPMLFQDDSFFSVVFQKELLNVEQFFFAESNGSDYDMSVLYKLDKEDGICIAEVKPEGVKEKKTLTTAVGDDFVESLESILTDHRIESWNGYQESEEVLDGAGFSLHVILTDGTQIDASGYMAWPDGYSSFSEELHRLFCDLYEKKR